MASRFEIIDDRGRYQRIKRDEGKLKRVEKQGLLEERFKKVGE